MLPITIELSPEGWDEKKEEFVKPKTQTLQLEHSLLSLSKWESKWHKPFLHTKVLTYEESVDYVKFMTLNQNIDPEVYNYLSEQNMREIRAYIEAPMTATTFAEERGGKTSREIVTAEIIYYWMITSNIPFECQKWHLNRLFTLIRVCSKKNAPPKKMSRGEVMRRNAELNAKRRKQLNSKG